jgi:SulP family sulfate permease
MSNQTNNWFGDVTGGLTAMLVALPSSIAFGVLAYSSVGAEYAGMGAMAGLLGAAALGLVTPFIGRTAGLIAAPCAPAAAVLTSLMTGMAQGGGGLPPLSPANIFPLVALTALLAALLQILFGLIRGGSLIKFIPYPVVTGYLSGVGVIIALAQLPKALGLPPDITTGAGLLLPGQWQLESISIACMTIVIMALAPRMTQRIPAAVLGLASGMLTYFALAQFQPGLLQLEHNTLVIGQLQTSGSFTDSVSDRAKSLLDIQLADITRVFYPALTLAVLLSIDTLKTCVALDALTRSRHNSDRELIGQGLGNLTSFLSGGMPGAGTMGPTLVNISSGAKTWRSGVIEGLFVILAVVFLSPLIAWVPVSALSGILLVVAWRMFDKHIFALLRYRSSRMDFVVIAAVIITAVGVGLIAAAGVGIAMTMLLFIRNIASSSVIRSRLYLNQTSSKTSRDEQARAVLNEHGKEAVFCELQGSLFFGTTDQLFTQLEHDMNHCRFIQLDLRRVQALDYTAANLFNRIQQQLSEKNGQLLLSGLPSGLHDKRDFENYLRQLGVVGEKNTRRVKISETLDEGLEWIEDHILRAHGVQTRLDKDFPLTSIKLFQVFGEPAFSLLQTCLREVSLVAGEKLFSCGDAGDELFLVVRGAVAFYLPLEGGKRHHLDTSSPGSFFGEVAFLDQNVRAADAIAKTDCLLYGMSRHQFDAVFADMPEVRAEAYASLALLMAERLRQTSKQLGILQER